MKTIIAITVCTISACVAAPATNHKIFPNDPDISPGQPFWTEWDVTVELINKVDTVPNCSVQTVIDNTTTATNFYFNQYDISTCSEPSASAPCITISHPIDSKEYIPYFTWTTFTNVGTFKKPEWTVDFWFNYNQTNTYKVGHAICDGKTNTFTLDPCITSAFSAEFSITCNRDETGFLTLSIDQTTDGRTFNLHKFQDWRPFTNIVKPTTSIIYKSTESTVPPRNEPCKSCQ